jgi:hypothetical protein
MSALRWLWLRLTMELARVMGAHDDSPSDQWDVTTVFHAEADVAISGLDCAWVSVHRSWTLRLLRAFLASSHASSASPLRPRLSSVGRLSRFGSRLATLSNSNAFSRLRVLSSPASQASPCVISALYPPSSKLGCAWSRTHIHQYGVHRDNCPAPTFSHRPAHDNEADCTNRMRFLSSETPPNGRIAGKNQCSNLHLFRR